MSQVLEAGRADADRPVAADQWLAIGVIVTGLVATFGVKALRVEPDHPHQAWELVARVLELAFFGLAFSGSYVALQRKSRVGYAGLAAASYVLLAYVIGCVASGHHAFGAWWAGQMALALAFTAVSTVAAAITRPGSPRAAS